MKPQEAHPMSMPTPLPMSMSTPQAVPPRVAPIARPAAGASVFAPMFMLALAVVGWFAVQAVQLVLDRRQLNAAVASLDAQVQTATTVRSALDGVATATARLASAGNPNAKVVVDELRKRGVTINADSAAAK